MLVTSSLGDATNLHWLNKDGEGVLKPAKKENHFGIVQKLPNDYRSKSRYGLFSRSKANCG